MGVRADDPRDGWRDGGVGRRTRLGGRGWMVGASLLPRLLTLRVLTYATRWVCPWEPTPTTKSRGQSTPPPPQLSPPPLHPPQAPHDHALLLLPPPPPPPRLNALPPRLGGPPAEHAWGRHHRQRGPTGAVGAGEDAGGDGGVRVLRRPLFGPARVRGAAGGGGGPRGRLRDVGERGAGRRRGGARQSGHVQLRVQVGVGGGGG